MNCFLKVTTVLLIMAYYTNFASGQLIVAHRGASFDAPENTMAAFNLAWQQNADGIEGDFYLTKDKQIVCIHDANTKRTAGTNKVVAESTLDELRQLEFGSWKNKKYNGEPIPTFADVLNSIPKGKRFVIELKIGPEIVPPLAAALKKSSIDLDQLLIISFNADTIRKSKEVLPSIKAHWLTGFKQNKSDKSWQPTLDDLVATWKHSKADGIGFNGNRDVIDEKFVSELNSHGCHEFHVWTIDDADDARCFRDLGAYGITTNRPQLIRDSL